MRPYVDHHPPRQTFRAALEGKNPRVPTIRAASGKGKSRLIGDLRQECKMRGVPVTLLDFRTMRASDTFTVLGLVRYFMRALSFPAYDAALSEYLQSPTPGVTLENVTLTASNLGDITAGDLNRRRVIADRLTDALLRDLETCCASRRVALLIDTFEQAAPEVQDWLGRHVLPGACDDVEGLALVIAGQETPPVEPAHWPQVYRHFDLPDGLDWNDWVEYAQAIGAWTSLGESQLRRYYTYYKGDPKRMCDVCDPLGAEAL